MYDDVVFADRFRYPLTMFGNRILTVLSGLLHAHIEHEIDTAKNIAACTRISYCLHDFIRLNSIAYRVQTTRRYDVVFAIRIRYSLTMFGNRILIVISQLLQAHFAYETDTAKTIQHSAEFSMFA